MAKKILITGSSGLIGSHVVQEFLEHGWHVVGLDNGSKYGERCPLSTLHARFDFHAGDAKDVPLLKRLLNGCDHLLALAATNGGIRFAERRAFDLLAENDRITAATFDAAIDAYRSEQLQKITVVSSSMVYESVSVHPTPEQATDYSPPPRSTYAFQKLACEFYAAGAYRQYGLPYTVVRPFNCVGTTRWGAIGTAC